MSEILGQGGIATDGRAIPMSAEHWLLECAKQGFVQEAERLLAEGGVNLSECKDHEGRTPLHLAARAGKGDMVRLLLRYGADIFSEDRALVQPVHEAALSGDVDTLRALTVEASASVLASDVDGRIVAHYAVRSGSLEMLQEIHRLGGLNHAENVDQETPLAAALKDAQEEAARFLVQKGADVNVALLYLCDMPEGRPAQVRQLLDMGANPESQTQDGWRPAMMASRYGHERTLEVLLDDPRTTQETLNMSLAVVLYFGKRRGLSVVLLSRGADGRIPGIVERLERGFNRFLYVEQLCRHVNAELIAGGLDAAMPCEGAPAPAARGFTL